MSFECAVIVNFKWTIQMEICIYYYYILPIKYEYYFTAPAIKIFRKILHIIIYHYIFVSTNGWLYLCIIIHSYE